MIRETLDDLGGKQYLMVQAEKNPTAFLTLLGKIIPSDVNAKLSGCVKVDGRISFIRPDDSV